VTEERTSSRDRMWNLFSLVLLTAGLVSFAVFHFVPGTNTGAGWEIWVDLTEVLRRPELLKGPETSVIVASFLMISFLIVASPFLTGMLRKSRPCWWMAATMSALATIAFTLVLAGPHGPSTFRFGDWALCAAPLFNLLGLLMIRGSRAPSGMSS